MKRNICSIEGDKAPTRKATIKTLGLSLAIALVLAPVANLAVVRDNVGGMDTSVSQEGNTPNGGATEDQILEGYGAYVDGQLVEGNIPTANVTDTIINDLNDSVTIPGHTYIDEDLTIGLSSSFLKDATNGATATANKMLQGETAYVDGELVTGTIPSLAAKTYTPGTTNQTIASGKYLSGTQTIVGDADLISSNIKSGANIFGVAGNSNVVDTSAGNATATQILKDKVAYVDGSKITGTMTNNADATKTATAVTESGDNVLISIPDTGYYNTNSKINVSIETLKNEVTSLNSSIEWQKNTIFSKSGEIAYQQTINANLPVTQSSDFITSGDLLKIRIPKTRTYTILAQARKNVYVNISLTIKKNGENLWTYSTPSLSSETPQWVSESKTFNFNEGDVIEVIYYAYNRNSTTQVQAGQVTIS